MLNMATTDSFTPSTRCCPDFYFFHKQRDDNKKNTKVGMGRPWVNASQGELMTRLSFVVCFLLLFATPILAQTDVPRAEVFGGYAHNIGNAQGWNASAAVNANRWFGVVADFGGLTAKETEQDIESESKAY